MKRGNAGHLTADATAYEGDLIDDGCAFSVNAAHFQCHRRIFRSCSKFLKTQCSS